MTPASHANPVFVTVDGAPIRAIRALEQAWKTKSPQAEREAAQRAYRAARRRYEELQAEAHRR